MNIKLHGPFELSKDHLESTLPKSISGVFALGYVDQVGRFRVERVGRDTSNLQTTLGDLIGCAMQFKYAATSTSREAFELECELYHRLRPPCNVMHPNRPAGSIWTCPVCHGSRR